MNRKKGGVIRYLIFLVFMGSCCFADPRADFLFERRYLKADRASETATILLSEIHSGSTWCRYLIEYITKKPTMQIFDFRDGNLPFGLFFEDLGVDLEGQKIWKSHDSYYISALSQDIERAIHSDKDRLIFILRDYKEVAVKRFREPETIKSWLIAPGCNYFEILRIYDRWEDKNKLLILYKDLILNPEKVLKQLCDFFTITQEKIPAFMDDFEFHQKRARNTFNQNFGRSESLDASSLEESLTFHQKQFQNSFWGEIECIIEKNHPDLWGKYLRDF